MTFFSPCHAPFSSLSSFDSCCFIRSPMHVKRLNDLQIDATLQRMSSNCTLCEGMALDDKKPFLHTSFQSQCLISCFCHITACCWAFTSSTVNTFNYFSLPYISLEGQLFFVGRYSRQNKVEGNLPPNIVLA